MEMEADEAHIRVLDFLVLHHTIANVKHHPNSRRYF